VLKFNAASLYLLLYRLEKRGWIEVRWVEKAGERRRRFYKLTKDGKKALAAQHLGIICGRHQSRNGTGKCLTGSVRSDSGWLV
jgi:DNA-binding PadR family transcriptional regulator